MKDPTSHRPESAGKERRQPATRAKESISLCFDSLWQRDSSLSREIALLLSLLIICGTTAFVGVVPTRVLGMITSFC
jgi:hypothetical protein